MLITLCKIVKMKNIYFCFFFLFAVIITSSCVSSLYPISDNEKDPVFREELLGHWSYKGMQTQVIIKKAANKKYSVTVIDKKNKESNGNHISFLDTSYFSGLLVQLSDQLFFDCTPDTDHPQFNCLGEETRSALLPLHFIYKIYSIGKDEVSIAGMDIDSMKKFIAKYPNRVKHENISKDHILLTATAAGLQKNILTNKEAAFVFDKPEILYRKK